MSPCLSNATYRDAVGCLRISYEITKKKKNNNKICVNERQRSKGMMRKRRYKQSNARNRGGQKEKGSVDYYLGSVRMMESPFSATYSHLFSQLD